jgi:catechol 2,3-dioxygenase-like lactoylglutathione lyase family enzyme
VSDSTPQQSDWPPAVGAITLFVDDLDESKDFYRRALALDVFFEDGQSAVFRFGEQLINLLHVDAAPELIEPAKVAAAGAGHRAVYTLRVPDVDAVASSLQARGVTLLNGPMDRPWGPRTASFCDPSGHIWEIAT